MYMFDAKIVAADGSCLVAGRFVFDRDPDSEIAFAVPETIEALNPKINYITYEHFDQASKEAQQSEDRYRRGDARPLEGITVAIKDEFNRPGWRTTQGSLIFKESLPATENSAVIDSLEVAAPSCRSRRQCRNCTSSSAPRSAPGARPVCWVLHILLSPQPLSRGRGKFFRPSHSTERGQQPGHQPAAIGKALHHDVLVQRMCAGAMNAQAIKCRDPHRAGEVAVRAAA